MCIREKYVCAWDVDSHHFNIAYWHVRLCSVLDLLVSER
jgi:hypothetical protein